MPKKMVASAVYITTTQNTRYGQPDSLRAPAPWPDPLAMAAAQARVMMSFFCDLCSAKTPVDTPANPLAAGALTMGDRADVGVARGAHDSYAGSDQVAQVALALDVTAAHGERDGLAFDAGAASWCPAA